MTERGGISIAPDVFIGEDELVENFIRSSGPGGQNVNKVATAVQLRFDARNAPGLPERVRERTISLAGQRATKDGVIVIEASRFRTQERNRQAARDRLAAPPPRAGAAPAPPPPTARPGARLLDHRRRVDGN
jgi:ribosome-associated protein